ncbi:recombinase family protein [Streptomyces globosus]|uniref:recombinase family protein n=1 Tax=Streptomyces globosus TaxID=68209 RepID=UPI00380E94D7
MKPTQNTPKRAILLVRISDDKAEDARGVGRQEADGRALADRLGWTIAEVITENDTSAFKRRKVMLPDGSTALRTVRPGFRNALDKLSSGARDGLIADDLDRVARDPRDLEDLIDVVEQRHIPAIATTGSMRLDNDAGITMARVMVAIANKSSRDTRRRVARKHQELAEEGKPGGGGFRGYGFTRNGMEVIPAEAKVIRWMAERILDPVEPWALNRIAADLERRGVPSATGAKWSGRSVRSIVTKPSVAGLRAHKGEVVGPAVWSAILERDVWEAVCATLAGRAGSTDLTLKRWLTGALWCPLCRHSLTGWQGNHGPRYWCATPVGGCGKIAIKADRAEAEVARRVLDLLTKPNVLQRLTAIATTSVTEDVRRELAEDEAQLKQLAGMWARKELTFAEYREARAIIEDRVKESRTLVQSSAPRVLRSLLAGDVRKGWERLTPAGKREVVLTLLPDGYEVGPHDRSRGNAFDPGRLTPRAALAA